MINRNAVTIKPKEPFKVWIGQNYGDFDIGNNDYFSIYLIPEVDDLKDLDNVMFNFWKPIFEDELNNWCTDLNLWPKNRTYKMFKEWFELEYHSVINDLVGDEIIELDYPTDYQKPFVDGQAIFAKIISGGQTGADQGALDAALSLNHPCGGWCPKGRKSETGRIQDKYLLQEDSSTTYPACTKANVRDSDGTLVFTYGPPTGGTALTVDLAKKHSKPVYIFDFNQVAINSDPAEIFDWGAKNNVHVLNVTGPMESEKSGTRDLVETVMVQVLEFAR